MKKFFNWVLVLAACVGAFYGVGLIVPRSLSTTSRVDLQSQPDEVMARFSDVEHWAGWFPEVVSVRQQPEKNDHPVWRVSKPEGKDFDLEVTIQEERTWTATYTFEDSAHTLRINLTGFGEGTRVQVTRTSMTHDVWRRARQFLFMQGEPSSLAVLNALADALGEKARGKDE